MNSSQKLKRDLVSKVENWQILPIIVDGMKAYKFYNPDFLQNKR